MDSHGDVTQLLARITSGDPAAADELLGLLGEELHRLAEQHMRRQPAHHLLSPTALVSEAWVKLARRMDSDWSGRKHFICFASLAMRSVLVDYARKGQLPQEVPTTFADLPAGEVSDHVMNALDAAVMIERLAAFDETGAKVVTMRCFSEASNRDIAEVLGTSERTVARHWLDARAWLHREFSGDGHEAGFFDGGVVHCPVGCFAPNPFGLYDVHGNVAEWVADRYASYSVSTRPGDGLRDDPQGDRVYRGGHAEWPAVFARSSDRRVAAPGNLMSTLGVRAARPLEPAR